MNRRHFLTGMAGILASASAPAIVHNPMKIWVPRQGLLIESMRTETLLWQCGTFDTGWATGTYAYLPHRLPDGDLIVLSR